MFYLTTHSTHFIYGYMASDIWLRANQIVREEFMTETRDGHDYFRIGCIRNNFLKFCNYTER